MLLYSTCISQCSNILVCILLLSRLPLKLPDRGCAILLQQTTKRSAVGCIVSSLNMLKIRISSGKKWCCTELVLTLLHECRSTWSRPVVKTLCGYPNNYKCWSAVKLCLCILNLIKITTFSEICIFYRLAKHKIGKFKFWTDKFSTD
jgi:hypothetical protein